MSGCPCCMANGPGVRLLVMEFIEGAKISDVERLATIPADPVSLARTLIHVYLRQIVQFGLVQMDPHPGNFLVDSSGRLVMLDLGWSHGLMPVT